MIYVWVILAVAVLGGLVFALRRRRRPAKIEEPEPYFVIDGIAIQAPDAEYAKAIHRCFTTGNAVMCNRKADGQMTIEEIEPR